MNHEPKKECFKTSVGGQALMEGIMMRGPEHIYRNKCHIGNIYNSHSWVPVRLASS